MTNEKVEDEVAKSKQQLALQEYYFIEEQIDRFDDRSLKIKSWSVTAVAIGAALVQNKNELFLVASAGALVFWYIEAMWKYFQVALFPRTKHLEYLLNSDISNYTGPKIGQSYDEHFKWRAELRKFPKIFSMRNVNPLHSVIAIIWVLLYIYLK